ncbi:DUF4326 domain-containing protein [Natronosalvus caseinilyticus]|uniref:DUF4326 domain-containing protein n=1 Tax=Natronosalvus caseinilyticus TaxID=2953747 RepID=UPI0028A8412C|nr:DUF4326 domain-containing protein [Natronosalvus caseinilyticus]
MAHVPNETIAENILETIDRLVDAGETDAANGGVASSRIAEELERSPTTITRYCTALVERGDLEHCRGIGPMGVRDSYLPADGEPEPEEQPVWERQKLVTDGGSIETDPTRVAHCKADETDVYVGRGPGGRHLLNSLVDDRGWLGNPFTVDEYDRAESIRKFRTEFEAKLERDPTFAEAVANISGKTLGCWCQRLTDDEPACHAEVIAEWADRLDRSQQADTDAARADR